MQKHLIDKTYDLVKKNFNEKHFTFKEINNILSKNGIDIQNSIGELYIDMLQDYRFISLGKEKWALRENFTVSQIEKILSSIFGLDEYHEEDADKYMSKHEKEELISSKKDNIISIENDDIEDLDIKTLTKKVTALDEEDLDDEKSDSIINESDSNSFIDEDDEDEDNPDILDEIKDVDEEDDENNDTEDLDI